MKVAGTFCGEPSKSKGGGKAVADSEEKLCRLVSEFGRVCERRVNVGKSKVIRCSRYGNSYDAELQLKPLEEVD